MARAKVTTTRRRKKAKKTVPAGQMHIQASFNNTVIVFTDKKGAVLTWASAGSAGFKGSRKGTAYAAQIASEKAAGAVKEMGMKQVDVLVKGIGQGRESAVRALQGADIYVNSIQDVTGVPHNGCRPRKARRI